MTNNACNTAIHFDDAALTINGRNTPGMEAHTLTDDLDQPYIHDGQE